VRLKYLSLVKKEVRTVSVIDSDAHVIEYDHTWDYMDESAIKHRPTFQKRLKFPMRALMRAVAMIKHRPIPHKRPQSDGRGHGDKVVLPDASSNPRDVQARIRHMDELGTDVQVLYPTLFISPYTDDPEEELVMSRSYNHWLADIWRQGNGRLRWPMVLPLRTMDKAMEEMRWANQHGACAVFMRGVEIDNRLLSDSYFYPVYEEASSLDLPICVHTGNGSEDISRIYANESGFTRFKLVGVGACHNLLYTQTPDKFPKLRWGFILTHPRKSTRCKPLVRSNRSANRPDVRSWTITLASSMDCKPKDRSVRSFWNHPERAGAVPLHPGAIPDRLACPPSLLEWPCLPGSVRLAQRDCPQLDFQTGRAEASRSGRLCARER
jgi:predicted TIM-barrel fold metal-dependent hydrolase